LPVASLFRADSRLPANDFASALSSALESLAFLVDFFAGVALRFFVIFFFAALASRSLRLSGISLDKQRVHFAHMMPLF